MEKSTTDSATVDNLRIELQTEKQLLETARIELQAANSRVSELAKESEEVRNKNTSDSDLAKKVS